MRAAAAITSAVSSSVCGVVRAAHARGSETRSGYHAKAVCSLDSLRTGRI
eukprot:gene21933-11299_t